MTRPEAIRATLDAVLVIVGKEPAETPTVWNKPQWAYLIQIKIVPTEGRDQPSDSNSPGLSVDPGTCGARINSRCIRSTIVVSALLHLFRSAWPYRTPLIAQFASRRSLGVSRCTMTPTKPSHLGSAFLTASVIADCKRSRETELRSSDDCFFGSQAKTAYRRQKYG
jgi:hypothetical protein